MTGKLATIATLILLNALLYGSYAHYLGLTLDCQLADFGGFCAIRAKSKSGLSVQYADELSVWIWPVEGENSRRVWPVD